MPGIGFLKEYKESKNILSSLKIGFSKVNLIIFKVYYYYYFIFYKKNSNYVCNICTNRRTLFIVKIN